MYALLYIFDGRLSSATGAATMVLTPDFRPSGLMAIRMPR